LCGVIETGISFNNFVSCNIFDCWELLHSSSRKPLDKVVTLFSATYFVQVLGTTIKLYIHICLGHTLLKQ